MKTLLANRRAKGILLGLLSLALAGTAAAVMLAFKHKPTDVLENGAVVYEDGGAVFAFIGGEKVQIENHSADRFTYDEAGERLYYTVASSYSSGTFDLYFITPGGDETTLVDYGIGGDYYLGCGGEKLYYSKKSDKSRDTEGICYDLAGRQMITFTQNPEALFVPKRAEEIYFTRLHGSTQVLYAYRPGGKPQELFRGAEEIRLYDSESAPELLFQSGTGTENVSLQIVYQGEKPLLISDGVKQVLWDDYKAGDNLYYCTACNNGVSWRAVIGDSFAESDSAMNEPVRGDYISVFGYHLGYPSAKAAYDRKVKRDAVRSALDVAFSEKIGSCDAYAYNKQGGSVLLAENIRADSIKAAAPAGEPKLLFGSVKTTETALDVADLTTMAEQGGVEAAVTSAVESAAIKTENNGLQMAVIYQGAVSSYRLQGYPQAAGFCFSQDGTSLFAMARKGETITLFCGSFTEEQKPENGQAVVSGITDPSFTRAGAVYMKAADAGTPGTVYRWDGEKTEILSENSYAFLVKGGVYSFKNYVSSANGDKVTADYYYCGGGKEKLLGKGVAVNSIMAGENGRAAFLCADGLKLCNGGDTVKISNQATQILYIH